MKLALLLAVFLSQADPPRPPRKLPADREAYAAAGRIQDPAAKIAAYRQFLRDFPGAPQAYSAQREIFETTVELHRGDRAKVMGEAHALLKSTPRNDYGRLAAFLAGHLHSENLFPKDAERLAKMAVRAHGSPVRRANAEDTLGQIYRRAGDTKQAERWLKQALARHPALSESATALGEMAEAAGRDADAIAYFAQARLARPGRETHAPLEKAWRKTHESADGLDAYLDQRYRALFPSPIRVQPYEKSARRTHRVVLAEVHTGAGCGPCLAADLAIDAALQRYTRGDLAVVMYHQHIPVPDPLTNDGSAALFKERGGRGVPYIRIDGEPIDGSGLRDQAPIIDEGLRRAIDRRLETAPGAGLTLAAVRDGRSIQVMAQVAETAAAKLRLVLVERLVTYSGENGIRFHPMVARSLHTVEAAPRNVEHRFDLAQVAAEVKGHLDRFEAHEENFNAEGRFRFFERKDAIDERNLAVVAYLESGREVLQAAYVELRP